MGKWAEMECGHPLNGEQIYPFKRAIYSNGMSYFPKLNNHKKQPKYSQKWIPRTVALAMA